jgi:hypothetical protein
LSKSSKKLVPLTDLTFLYYLLKQSEFLILCTPAGLPEFSQTKITKLSSPTRKAEVIEP